jgi:hypothetical protein
MQPAARVPMALQQRLRLVCAEGEVVSRRCGRRLGGHQGGHGPVARDRCAPRGRALLGAGGRQASAGANGGAPWSHMAAHIELRGRPWRRARAPRPAMVVASRKGVQGRPLRPLADLAEPAAVALDPATPRCSPRRSTAEEPAGLEAGSGEGASRGSFFCTPPEMRVGREVAVSGGGACAR